jgi:hypothetical protein
MATRGFTKEKKVPKISDRRVKESEVSLLPWEMWGMHTHKDDCSFQSSVQLMERPPWLTTGCCITDVSFDSTGQLTYGLKQKNTKAEVYSHKFQQLLLYELIKFYRVVWKHFKVHSVISQWNLQTTKHFETWILYLAIYVTVFITQE